MNTTLKVKLTPSEKWAAEQLSKALRHSLEVAQQADRRIVAARKGVVEARGLVKKAEETRAEFTTAVLKAHRKISPGYAPKLVANKKGAYLVWDGPPESKPVAPAPVETPAKAKPAKAAKKKTTKKKRPGRGKRKN